MKESKNAINTIRFYAEKEYIVDDTCKTRYFRVTASELIELGYDIIEQGYNEYDELYLDQESYKNFMTSQTYYHDIISNKINRIVHGRR